MPSRSGHAESACQLENSKTRIARVVVTLTTIKTLPCLHGFHPFISFEQKMHGNANREHRVPVFNLKSFYFCKNQVFFGIKNCFPGNKKFFQKNIWQRWVQLAALAFIVITPLRFWLFRFLNMPSLMWYVYSCKVEQN